MSLYPSLEDMMVDQMAKVSRASSLTCDSDSSDHEVSLRPSSSPRLPLSPPSPVRWRPCPTPPPPPPPPLPTPAWLSTWGWSLLRTSSGPTCLNISLVINRSVTHHDWRFSREINSILTLLMTPFLDLPGNQATQSLYFTWRVVSPDSLVSWSPETHFVLLKPLSYPAVDICPPSCQPTNIYFHFKLCQ